MNIPRTSMGNIEDDSRVAVLMERAKEKILLQRRLDFGEFVYLCNMRPKDNRWNHSVKKEAYRCVDIVCDIDMYEVQRKDDLLQWPPGEGAIPRAPRCMYRYGGDLATGKVDSPRTRKKKNAERWKRHKREVFGPSKKKGRESLKAAAGDGEQVDPEPLY